MPEKCKECLENSQPEENIRFVKKSDLIEIAKQIKKDEENENNKRIRS